MQLNQAFTKLRNTGPFVEAADSMDMLWYWHTLTNGFKIMACRSVDGIGAPTFYHEFFFNENPIKSSRL